MQNLSTLRGPGEEEVPDDTGDYYGLMGTYFSPLNRKQPKGLSCQEAYNFPKFGPGIPDDSSEIDDSPPSTTRSQTNKSSNPVNPNSTDNFNPLVDQNPWMQDRREGDELLDNFGTVPEPLQRNDYVNEAHKMEEEKNESDPGMNIDNFYAMGIEIESPQIINNNHGNEMHQEEGKKETEFYERVNSGDTRNQRKEEEQIENESEKKPKSKQSTKMKTLPALFMVEVKRAYQYYRTHNVSKKKYELESIGRVIRFGRFGKRTLEEFDQWIKRCKPKKKTYEELIDFLTQNGNPEMEALLKKFATCIFKNEKEIWLEKSGTKKKKQFSEVLDTFAVTFLYVLEFKKLPCEK